MYKRFCTVLSLNIYREAGRERGSKRLIYCEELAYTNCGGGQALRYAVGKAGDTGKLMV